jgi:hypothetical protein
MFKNSESKWARDVRGSQGENSSPWEGYVIDSKIRMVDSMCHIVHMDHIDSSHSKPRELDLSHCPVRLSQPRRRSC